MSTHPCLKSAKHETFRNHLAYRRHKTGPSPVMSCGSFKHPQGTRLCVFSSSEICSEERRALFSLEVSSYLVSEGKPSFRIYLEIMDHIWSDLELSSPWSSLSNLSPGVMGYTPCQHLCWGLGKRFGYVVCMPQKEHTLMWRWVWWTAKGQMPWLCLPFLCLPLCLCVCHGNKMLLMDGFGWCLFLKLCLLGGNLWFHRVWPSLGEDG